VPVQGTANALSFTIMAVQPATRTVLSWQTCQNGSGCGV